MSYEAAFASEDIDSLAAFILLSRLFDQVTLVARLSACPSARARLMPHVEMRGSKRKQGGSDTLCFFYLQDSTNEAGAVRATMQETFSTSPPRADVVPYVTQLEWHLSCALQRRTRKLTTPPRTPPREGPYRNPRSIRRGRGRGHQTDQSQSAVRVRARKAWQMSHRLDLE